MKTIVMTLLLLLGSAILVQADDPSKSIDYSFIDDYARATPRKHTTSVKKLATHISEAAETDFETVRGFYTWIGKNMKYDMERMRNNKNHSLYAENVLKRRKGICGDISQLFKALCDEANIKCVDVWGVAKIPLHKTPRKAKSNHAWNMVTLEGELYLIDATWGLMATTNRDFSDEVNYEFFLTDPETFAKQHFPDNPVWQLIDNPYTYRGFRRGVYSGERASISYLDSIETWSKLSRVDALHRQLILQKEFAEGKKYYIAKYFVHDAQRLENTDYTPTPDPTLDDLYNARASYVRAEKLCREIGGLLGNGFANGIESDIYDLDIRIKRMKKKEERKKAKS